MSDTETFTAQDFNLDELRRLEESARTAESISNTRLDEEMGKRAKARKRAARQAAELTDSSASSVAAPSALDETDCEIPEAEEKQVSPSRIPVLQKGTRSSSSVTGSLATTTNLSNYTSRIPRPKAKLIYLPRGNLEQLLSDTESNCTLSSYTGNEPSLATSEMVSPGENHTCRDHIPPLQHCDISTMSESLTEQNSLEQPEQLTVLAEGGGVQVQLNLSALISGMNMEVAGIKIV